MIELVFLACLRVTPDVCDERRLSYQNLKDLAVCTMNAQPYLAQWARDHPAYTVTTWRCEDPARRPIRA
jgi:hypothetical protein